MQKLTIRKTKKHFQIGRLTTEKIRHKRRILSKVAMMLHPDVTWEISYEASHNCDHKYLVVTIIKSFCKYEDVIRLFTFAWLHEGLLTSPVGALSIYAHCCPIKAICTSAVLVNNCYNYAAVPPGASMHTTLWCILVYETKDIGILILKCFTGMDFFVRMVEFLALKDSKVSLQQRDL